MRIAVFSDIHGNLPALESILKDIKTNNINRVICLGDVIGIGPEPKACLDLIMKNNIEMVLGNHELYYIRGTKIDHTISNQELEHFKWIWSCLSNEHYNYLRQKPLSITMEVKGHKFLFQHFLINKDKVDDYPFYGFTVLKEATINTLVDELNSDYIFIGHEHRPYEVTYHDKVLFDGGSSGCVYNDITHYTIIDINDDVIITRREINYNRDALVKAFKISNYALNEYLGENFFGIIK